MLVVYLCTIIIIVATSCIMVFLLKSRSAAQQSGGNKRWQGMVTVVATASVYCISALPYALHFLIELIDPNVVELDTKTKANLTRLFESLNTLNIMCNFFIYSFAIPSFRAFIKSMICKVMKCHVLSRRQKDKRSAVGDQNETEVHILQESNISGEQE